jgi:hypothetical protein
LTQPTAAIHKAATAAAFADAVAVVGGGAMDVIGGRIEVRIEAQIVQFPIAGPSHATRGH